MEGRGGSPLEDDWDEGMDYVSGYGPWTVLLRHTANCKEVSKSETISNSSILKSYTQVLRKPSIS